MTGSGPQLYPGADTTHWWQAEWGGDLMEVNVLVLHTTEGIGLPNYDNGSMAPNLTAVANMAAKKLKWYQHFDIDRSSRALRNLAGGVQTNTLNVTQVELDGTCDYTKRTNWGSRIAGKDYIYWGNPPDWALQQLADFLAWLHKNHNVPLTGPSMWLTYGPDTRRPGITPASYGASPARMSFAQWNEFKGICGHQHVPENDHGDPGSLPFARLIALVGATQPTKPKPSYELFPGSSFFTTGRRSPIIAAMHKRLVAEGCNKYASSSNADVWGPGDVRSYAAWQRHLGYAGSGADGIPGKASWDKLHVPNV
ncbi:peptidoglycan-binding protein [Streptomyces sp. NPDC058464]|uniref:peptidoglycan-binding protein n=1 Tax=Streptomyces sp. NPDC058464 TaxID=3346511 RepID=UPI00366140A7